MKEKNIREAPIMELFMIFFTYGGLICLVLTAFYWKWSGMASLGIFYLIFIAPIAMGTIAYRYRHMKAISTYHHWAYIFGLAYFVIAPVVIYVLFSVC